MSDEHIISLLMEHFKSKFNFNISNSSELFKLETNILAFLIELGCKLSQEFFNNLETGYKGTKLSKNGTILKNVGNREKWIH